jgi:hypothetical protein
MSFGADGVRAERARAGSGPAARPAQCREVGGWEPGWLHGSALPRDQLDVAYLTLNRYLAGVRSVLPA